MKAAGSVSTMPRMPRRSGRLLKNAGLSKAKIVITRPTARACVSSARGDIRAAKYAPAAGATRLKMKSAVIKAADWRATWRLAWSLLAAAATILTKMVPPKNTP